MRPLPAGVQREFDLALQRTGWTPALEIAWRMLSVLFVSDPEEVERLFKITLDKCEPNL